jgi:multicomponent Na+:H+ antiporter subunit F
VIAAFAVAGLVLLAVASGLVLYRIFVGPSNLDRIVATDILLIIVIAGIGLDAAWHRRDTSLPLLVILGLVSFVGGVAVTRFLSHEDDPTGSAPVGLSFPPPANSGFAAPGRAGPSGTDTGATDSAGTDGETAEPEEEQR